MYTVYRHSQPFRRVSAIQVVFRDYHACQDLLFGLGFGHFAWSPGGSERFKAGYLVLNCGSSKQNRNRENHENIRPVHKQKLIDYYWKALFHRKFLSSFLLILTQI